MSSCSSCSVDNFKLLCEIVDIEIDSHLCFLPVSCVPSKQPDIPTFLLSKYLYIIIPIIAIALIMAFSSLCVFYFRKVPNSLLNEIDDSNGEEDVEVHFSID